MTAKDIDSMFKLLQIYFPNSDKPKDKKLKSAWLLVLQPYEKTDVKQALVDHLRRNTFFPDVQSIAVKCPPPCSMLNHADGDKPTAQWDKQRDMVVRFQLQKKQRRDAGIPETWQEAQAAGMKAMEWAEELDKAGLGAEVILKNGA